MARSQYDATRQRERQERFAAGHPLTLSMPAPATVYDVTGLTSQADLTTLPELHNHERSYVRVGDWYIRASESVSYDRNRYSKAWHRAHGGAKTVDRRTLLIRRVRADGTLDARDVDIQAWRGNYALDALVSAGIVTPTQVGSALKPVQLHPAFTIQPLRTGSLSVYARRLGGEPYDYCVVWHGITYHAESIALAITGLRAKLKNVTAQRNAPITWGLGKKLGFCDEGMRQFARDYGLDVDGRYTPAQIEAAVRGNVAAASPYRAELCKLAEAVGHAVAECL